MSLPRTKRALHSESVNGSWTVVQVYKSLSDLWEYLMASGCLNFVGGRFEWKGSVLIGSGPYEWIRRF